MKSIFAMIVLGMGTIVSIAGMPPAIIPPPLVDKQPIDKPVPIFSTRRMATYDPSTGKVNYESNVSPDDVVNVLVSDLNLSIQQLGQCKLDLYSAKKEIEKLGPHPKPWMYHDLKKP